MLENISFEYPFVLLLIIPFILCSIFCKEKSPSFLFVHLNLFKKSTSKANHFIPILKYLAFIFAIIALASPVEKLKTIPLKKDGIDIILSLDTSGSMKERGFNPDNMYENRWDVVKQIVNNFIEKRTSDNIGLVVFGTNVMTASPLSFDKQSQIEILRYLNIGLVGENTALIDSVASSIKILKTSKAKSKVIIVLTDGLDTASKIPVTVVNKLAIKHKIKIYAIGIGNSNKLLLDSLVNNTKGKSFIAYSKNSLEQVYEQIDKLEKSKIDNKHLILKEYLFFYPLFISIMALIILIYIKNKN